MERIVKERDRLLRRSARLLGIVGAAAALLCLVLPGTIELGSLAVLLPFFALLFAGLYRVGVSGSLVWMGVAVLSGDAIILLVHFASTGLLAPITGVGASPTGLTDGAETAIRFLASWTTASVAIVLVTSLGRMLLLAAAFAATLAATLFSALAAPDGLVTLGAVVAGWAVASTLGSLLGVGVVRAARRISNIGRAHRAERQASETEAQRRQGARLLHDTVLASLTLLAHQGLGVSTDAMVQQAGDDARLLRQLRLGTAPLPAAAAEYNLKTPVEESTLGNTLEAVKQRFGRMGLSVSWHGTGQVLLPGHILDAFLGSLAECLENVRRHAGVEEAHVTITDDDTTIRAMVTDNGVGFDQSTISEGRLGFKESVVARLREVGGNVRVFSAPGSGTTVVLEVPK
ncbi:sensor histidine kinase [Amnibacterium flavum]|uniref:Histidine kinase n=1 Tax=Amnibacterium flavum TaxID=2173173 RepID=A0A2V1HND9_9MICO|nr:ATP-binding protein [Amnibacterium flavum]PVZ93921.1 histidine kinase [Amnibacterium flavum]